MAVLEIRIANGVNHGILKSRQTPNDGGNSTISTTSASGTSGTSSGLSTAQIVFIVVTIVLFIGISSISIFVVLRNRKARRAKSISESKSKSKSISFFSRFRSGSNRGQYSAQLQPTSSSQGADGDSLTQTPSVETRSRDVEMELVNERSVSTRNNTTSNNNTTNNTEAGVDRHTSVRSIMTLPPYSVAARPTEQVLGREGERAGIDLVIEQPETNNEEEERREEEMNSLYQIRRARREEIADREERRRLRREARERGDTAALRQMQQEARQRAQAQTEGMTLSAQLIAEHQGRNRERRVSAVQYQHIGVARHDGSRVRNKSIDSDNRPLLSSAASISGTAGASSLNLHQHGRDRSTTSFQSISSIDTTTSDDATRTASRNNDFEIISLDGGRTRSHSSAAQSGNQIVAPIEPPPEYDDAPSYESSISQTLPQLPRISPIPSIRVSPTITPIPSPHP